MPESQKGRRPRRQFDEEFRSQADRTHGRTGLTTAEREEVARLRKETRELRTERDILKKAAAFFAKHQA
jgi:transposase